jgi:hypothetical protein
VCSVVMQVNYECVCVTCIMYVMNDVGGVCVLCMCVCVLHVVLCIMCVVY